jgi:hypothetical protein
MPAFGPLFFCLFNTGNFRLAHHFCQFLQMLHPLGQPDEFFRRYLIVPFDQGIIHVLQRASQNIQGLAPQSTQVKTFQQFF